MFNWNVEEMKLLNMARVGEGYDKAFACESEVSIEDKFEFIDRMQGGKLSYLVGMAKAYQEAVSSMKKSAEGNPTDYAKKAWVRENDTQNIFCRRTDSYGDYGDFEILGYTGNLFNYPNRVGSYCRSFTCEDSFIHTLFHRQLLKCNDKEYDYFYSQDKTAQYLTDFENKYDKHELNRIEFEENYRLRIILAENGSEKNRVIFERFYGDYTDTEFALEEVQKIDAELTALDGLYDQLQKAQQAYEEARLAVAEKIKSMATN